MNNVIELSRQADPVDEASDWLARLDRGLSDGEEQVLQKWRDSDPKNTVALIEMARLWDKMDSLSRLADLFPLQVKRAPKPNRFAVAAAAAILLAVTAGLLSISNREPAGANQAPASAGELVFQTAIGEFSTVNLPDGSQLTLNTDSLVRAMFTRSHRFLVLERGEVYLQVAEDKSRPLNVKIGGNIVQALGTAFNLKITNDNLIELIVTEGKVLVGVIDKKAVRTGEAVSLLNTPDSALKVSVGQQLLLGNANEEVKLAEPEEIDVKLSWRGGKIIFRGESLEEALNEIGRYTPVEFVIMDENLKKIHIVGMFKAGDVQGLLTTLTENFDISYQRVSDETVILTNKHAEQEQVENQ
jgi:transmembrane sensor